MTAKNWVWTIGTAVLLHVVLILLTVVEVFIYSMLIEPGRDQVFYEAHAEASGPWVATIFGTIIIYFLVRRYMRRNTYGGLAYAWALPGIYILIDFIVLPFSGPDWTSALPIVLISNAIKLLAGLVSYRMNMVTQPL